MTLDVVFDDQAFQKKWHELIDDPSKNIAFSVQQALNDTVLQVQTQERIGIDRAGFHIRQAGFMYRLIKIFQFAKATKGIAFAEIGIDPNKGALLPLFEFEGQHKTSKTGANVAVPLWGQPGDPRRDITQLIDPKLQFQALDFQQGLQGILIGRQGTYIVPGVGVFQRGTVVRTAKGRRARADLANTHLIYAFKQAVPIPHKLAFFKIALDTFAANFQTNFAKRFTRAA